MTQLRRVLGFRDLLLFYLVTSFSLRWISTAAAAGPSAIVIWVIAALGFFVPLVYTVLELSSRYPHAHGAPIHIGAPEAIGITDLSRPDYDEPVPIDAQEIPVFWGCGVTSQAVAAQARVDAFAAVAKRIYAQEHAAVIVVIGQLIISHGASNFANGWREQRLP